MANIVEMPKLGFDMAEGTLVRWVVGEGSPIERGQVLAEIETDKATVEVESSFTGVVHRHLLPEGEIVPVGTPIAVIGEAGESIDLAALGLAGEPAGEKLTEETKPEEAVKQAVTSPVSAPAAEDVSDLPGGVKASPVARRMADEYGLDIKAIQGTGPGGRIIKSDIEAFLAKPAAAAPAAPAAEAAAPILAKGVPAVPMPGFSPVGAPPPDTRIKMTRMRSTIARRLVESVNQVPHIYVSHEYDISKVMELRTQFNALLEGTGEKLSVNDFVVKAAALALRQYPRLNASLQGDEIVEHGAVNIGVAVALEEGLLTVVCKDADRKSLRQISAEVRSMAGRAREGKVKPDDIEGSTFSVSNLGMFDVEHFTAIINPPESAILAVGSIRQAPIVKGDQVGIGMRMKMTISVDHRIIDGADAARFLQAVAVYLEEPLRLTL